MSVLGTAQRVRSLIAPYARSVPGIAQGARRLIGTWQAKFALSAARTWSYTPKSNPIQETAFSCSAIRQVSTGLGVLGAQGHKYMTRSVSTEGDPVHGMRDRYRTWHSACGGRYAKSVSGTP
eukprot:3093599-Rhodomonas_salina.1